MKRTLLTLSVIVASAFTMYGQARVAFNNLVSGNLITVGSFHQYPSGGSAGAYIGANYSVQLLWKAGVYNDQWAFDAANPSSSSPVAFLGTTGDAGSGAGYFDGGNVAMGGPPGTYTMQVRAWYNGGVYATYDAAQAAFANIGRSVLFTVTATASPASPPSTMFPSFQVGVPCLGPYFYPFYGPASQTVALGATATFSVVFDSGITPCPPPYYQWYFNGAPIPGANSLRYQITSAQLTNAGDYHVVLSNPYWGVHVSAIATLTVLTGPIITSGPQSQTAEAGSAAYFWAQATNSLPLFYLWYFNGTNFISRSTNCELELTNVQFAQAGAYTVVMSNTLGAVTSAPAMLSVIAPVERRRVPGLILMGQPGNALNLDAADILVPAQNWAAFDSVMLTNPSQWYFDLTTPLRPQRFYRSWQTGTPA